MTYLKKYTLTCTCGYKTPPVESPIELLESHKIYCSVAIKTMSELTFTAMIYDKQREEDE